MRREKLYLAYDIGGTKVEIGIVNEQGKILRSEKKYLDLDKGKEFFIQELLALGNSYLSLEPGIEHIGVSSCGPLDPREGTLLDPTNLLSGGKGWGRVPLKAIFETEFQKPVTVDNDAACSALAELHFGAGRIHDCRNLLVLTLGTGLGVGIICNGALLRGGRFLHPEAGHMIIQHEGSGRHCSCGVEGDSESYLSGKHFEQAFQREYQLAVPLSAEAVANLARKGDENAKKNFDSYARFLAVTLHNLCIMFYPEIVVFDGGFSSAFDQFAKTSQSYLQPLLHRRSGLMPKLMSSTLGKQSCLLGASYLCVGSA